MFHHDYVGHFDPCDAMEKSDGLLRPKTSRPISPEAYQHTLERFDPGVSEFVEFCADGWVICDWTRPPYPRNAMSKTVRDFARTLAENDRAVVMTEMFIIWFPGWAKQRQEEHWAQMARERSH